MLSAGHHVVWLVAVMHACMHSIGALTVIPEIQYAIIGSHVNFTCTPKVNNAYWIINGHAANGAHTDMQEELENEGYIFYTNSESLTVSIPARQQTNGTVIRCRGIFHGYSINNASLIVINPIAPLPPEISVVEDLSSSSPVIMVRWHQPFLWPEAETNFNQVLYYNITVREGEGNDVRLISNYTNATGQWHVDTTNHDVECHSFSVWVSAVNEYGASPQIFLTRKIPIVPEALPTDSTEAATYFDSGGNPVVFVSIKPPRLCSFQHFNYSIIAENTGSPLEAPIRIRSKGPSTNNMTIQEIISTGLERDAQYTVRVVIDVELGRSLSSEVEIDTHLYMNSPAATCDKSLYLSVMGGSIGLSVFILLTVIVALIVCMLYSRRGHRENIHRTNKPLSSMVNNPIYDGPIYESVVQDSFNTLQTATGEAAASAQSKGDTTPPPKSPSPDNNTVRYSDEPIQPSRKDKNSHSSLNGHSRATFDLTSRSASMSVPSKRTAQERNKLQLTLSLGNNPAAFSANSQAGRMNGGRAHSLSIHHPTAPKILPSIATVSSSQDENYTLMSPAGSRMAVLGSLENGFGPILSPEDTEKYQE